MIEFDGVSSLTHDVTFPDEITLCCWVYPYELKVTLLFGVLGAMVYMLTDGVVRNGVFGGYDIGPAIPKYEWTHITAYGNKTTGEGIMWYDGEVVAKGTNHTYAPTADKTKIQLGNAEGYTHDPYKMKGAMDDFRMYGRLLDENEIYTIADCQKQDFIIDEMEAWLPCDEPEGILTASCSPVNQEGVTVIGTPKSVVREKELAEIKPIEVTPIVAGTV